MFEWLADKTSLPFISPSLPAGTFNFVGPKEKKYTIPQIIDIINDSLLLAQTFTGPRRLLPPPTATSQSGSPALVSPFSIPAVKADVSLLVAQPPRPAHGMSAFTWGSCCLLAASSGPPEQGRDKSTESVIDRSV